VKVRILSAAFSVLREGAFPANGSANPKLFSRLLQEAQVQLKASSPIPFSHRKRYLFLITLISPVSMAANKSLSQN
jgi:hypothetical protein